jgi:signal transduction histidine kinase
VANEAAAVVRALRSEYDSSTVLHELTEMVVQRSVQRAGSRSDERNEGDDGDIESLLGELADAVGAHRVSIAEQAADQLTVRITYEWCDDRVKPERERFGVVPASDFPWIRERLTRGEAVSASSVEDLPLEASAERSEMNRRQAGSLAVIPLVFGPRALGMVVFEWAEPTQGPPLGAVEVAILQGLLATELHARQMSAALKRTNRMLRAMVQCSDALLRARDERALLEEVCRIIVEVGGHRFAWVGFGARDANRSVTPVAQWGDGAGYLSGLHVTWADIDQGGGPMSKAIRTGLPAVVENVATDPEFEPWREKALRHGFQSVLAVSLDYGDELLGALGVYADASFAFDSVEIEMMQRFADYLAFGIVAMRNRVERDKAEARLRETVRSKDELIASISHELRTPLTAVVGFAQLLRDDTHLSLEDRAAMISSIVDEGYDLSNIVEDLLTVAKAEAGTLEVVRVPVDLRAQAAQVIERLREEDAARVNLEGQTRRAPGDPGRVRQILRNLVSNALRYGGDPVTVRVVGDGSPRVQVRDRGPAIPIEDRDRIFESYQKAHRTPGIAGSVGLGLAISKTLAHKMGGELTYSYEEGHSVFELSFPHLTC